MRLMLTHGRRISIGAIALLLAAVPAFAQTPSPTPLPGPRLPPAAHLKAPLHQILPTFRNHANLTPSTPIPEYAPTSAQLKFAEAYVKAISDGDKAEFRKLIAPKALACFNQKNEVFLDEWIDRQMRDLIEQPYKITIEQLDPDDMGKSRLFTLPVPPTHQMDINTKLNGQEVSIGRPIVYQDGQWYEIAPCPTDAGVRHALRRQQYFARQHQQDVKLYNSLPPDFKKALYQLLMQDKAAEACDKTKDQLKVDLKTGCRVAAVLAAAIDATAKKEGALPAASSAAKRPPSPTPSAPGSARK